MLPSSWFLGLNPSDKSLQRRYCSVELRQQDKVGFLRCSPLGEMCKEFFSSYLSRQSWSNKTQDEDQDMEWGKAIKEKKGALVHVAYTNSLVLFLIHFYILWDFPTESEVHVCRNEISLGKSLSLYIKAFLTSSKSVWRRKLK